MVNSNALKDAIKTKGIKNKFVAEKLGITPNSLSRKISGKTELKLSEVETLCDVLQLGEKEKKTIFFAR